jgi:osmoprotectant transport system substrate-binding protein
VKPGFRPPLRIVAFAVCSLFVLSGCASKGSTEGAFGEQADRQGPTVIGTDNSAESRVVAALYGELLTAAGEEVQTVTSGYPSAVDTARAVVAGKLSLAPAYESTMLRALPSGQVVPGNMDATLSMALPVGIDALPPAAAQRGVVLAVTKATARRHELRSLADLRKAGSKLTLGGSASGDPDAPITRDGLVVLADPKHVIPPEHVFPLIGAPYAGREAVTALARVNTLLTTGQLAVLTSSVNAGETPSKAARTWLRSKGLLR